MRSTGMKAWIALGVLLLAPLAGLYLSGYLALLLLKVDVPLKWNTYPAYLKMLDVPQVARYAGKIKLAGALGFGAPLLAYAALLVALFKPKVKSLHGDARFAHAGDLASKDMLKPSSTGIVVGKVGGKLVRLPGQQFVILAAPTRSGKGVGVVIPNLLDYQGSVVVLDIKQENFDLTSGWRASQGQQVFLFNPFAEDRRTHRWNPLSYISPDPAFRVSDIQAIAAMLYPDGSDQQKFWVGQARNAFMALALYAFDNLEDQRQQGYPETTWTFPTLGGIYRLSSGDGSDLKAYLHGLSQAPFLGVHAKTAFANLLSQAEETFASIMGTFKEPLNAFINPILDAATSANDFLLTDVRKRKMTIYIGIQPNKLAESRLIVNLFFSQLINLNTKELPQANPALKHQCLLLMDEFTAIGKVDIIASAVSYMAGYNIRLLPIIQSMAQLDAVYGKDVSRTIITNHALQIVYAPREQRDANDYSDMLGYTTVRKQNVSRGKEVTRSESTERRALMLPQELKALGADKQVFLYEGIAHPVLCEKIRYYEDRYFTQRLLPKVEVPTLQIGQPPRQAVPKPPSTMPNAVPQPDSAAAFPPPTATPPSASVPPALEQEDPMKLTPMIAAASLALAACSPTAKDLSQDPDKAMRKLNPHPVKAYTVSLTIADAPGPFELVDGGAGFDVANHNECGEYNAATGTRMRIETSESFPMKRISSTEYRGTFYTDLMVDEDYFGAGICHWRFAGVGIGIHATGTPSDTNFVHRISAEEVLKGLPVKSYYWAGYYPRAARTEGYSDFGEVNFSSIPEGKRGEFFTLTVEAHEVTR